jgi:hypothetical protein
VTEMPLLLLLLLTCGVVWTGGNSGIMRLVGDALKEYKRMSMCIGIASWGPLDGKESLESETGADFQLGSLAKNSERKGTIDHPFTYTGTKLDKNHSHYILVDAGKDTNFGAEIEVRHELEDFVSFRRDAAGHKSARLVKEITENQQSDSKRSIPVICVCFGGGPGTIRTFEAAMYSGRPIILVKGSMRITDCVVALVELKKKMEDEAEQNDGSSGSSSSHSQAGLSGTSSLVASSPSAGGASSPRARRNELRVQQERLIDAFNDGEFRGLEKDLKNGESNFSRIFLLEYLFCFSKQPRWHTVPPSIYKRFGHILSSPCVS